MDANGRGSIRKMVLRQHMSNLLEDHSWRSSELGVLRRVDGIMRASDYTTILIGIHIAQVSIYLDSSATYKNLKI